MWLKIRLYDLFWPVLLILLPLLFLRSAYAPWNVCKNWSAEGPIQVVCEIPLLQDVRFRVHCVQRVAGLPPIHHTVRVNEGDRREGGKETASVSSSFIILRRCPEQRRRQETIKNFRSDSKDELKNAPLMFVCYILGEVSVLRKLGQKSQATAIMFERPFGL